MKILITGITGFANRGVEALATTTIKELLLNYPSAQISIVSQTAEFDAKHFQHPQVKYFQDHFHTTANWSQTWKQPQYKKPINTSILSKIKKRIFPKPEIIKNLRLTEPIPFEIPDLIVISGGDLFSSDYGTLSLNHYLLPVHWAKEHKIPAVLLAQSVGKFKSKKDIEIWKQAEDVASLITLREPLSFQYLTEELNSNPNKFTITTDTAFLLEPTKDIINQFTTSEQPTVAISISDSIATWTGNNKNEHIIAWTKLIKMMLDTWNVNIAIIPHVQEFYSDDRNISTIIARELNFDKRIKIFAEDLSANDYKAIISKCQLTIAERMHVAIAGLSSGICTVPISYSIKASGIMTDILKDSEIKLDELVMPLNALLDTENAKKKLTAIWNNRKTYATVITNAQPRLKKQAVNNFNLINQILNNH